MGVPFSGVNEEPPIPMPVLTVEAVPALTLCSCDLSKRLCKPLEIGQETYGILFGIFQIEVRQLFEQWIRKRVIRLHDCRF